MNARNQYQTTYSELRRIYRHAGNAGIEDYEINLTRAALHSQKTASEYAPTEVKALKSFWTR